jgi:hypothetical protein
LAAQEGLTSTRFTLHDFFCRHLVKDRSEVSPDSDAFLPTLTQLFSNKEGLDLDIGDETAKLILQPKQPLSAGRPTSWATHLGASDFNSPGDSASQDSLAIGKQSITGAPAVDSVT